MSTYTTMSVHGFGWFVVALVGFMFLMIATATTINASVGIALDINVAFDGEKAVCTCDLKTNVDLKMPDTCESCPSRLPNTTWLTYQPKDSSTPVKTIPKIMDFRIPTDLYPLHYEVELFPNMTDPDPKNFTFEGYVKIWMTCKKATDKLTLHSKVLKVDPKSIIFSGGPRYLSHKEDTDREFLILQLDTNTTVGKNYSVQLNFTSPLKNDLKGLYYSKYQRNGSTIYLATSYFQTSNARKAFPCFDEPAIKATFDITLVRPKNYTALSNMPLKETKTIASSSLFVKDVFVTTPLISTYLLAFVVSDFTHIENTTKNGVLFRVWSRPDVINQSKYAFGVGFKVLSYFEDFFNIKFPLPKLDSVAVPDHIYKGMENWGLIIYKEDAMITRNKDDLYVSMIVCHEIAHQWFGNLVSPAWWDAIWLNEGVATFVEYLGVDHYHPDWSVMELFTQSNNIEAFTSDSLVSSYPVFRSDYHPNESSSLFAPITYKKPAAIVRMMRHFLGFETFSRGLTSYLIKHKYSAATQDDLWSALTEQAKLENKTIEVKEVMDTWTLQMNYPLVTVTRDNSYNGALSVRQERFLQNLNASEIGRYVSPYNYTWNIPLTFTSNHTRNFDESELPIYWLWRNETSKSIDLADLLPSNDTTWFICNINMNGYYSVNYDRSNWMALSKQLKEDHHVIPVLNRVQLINDVWTLAKNNIIPYDTVFAVVEYLENEKHYSPLGAALNDLSNVGDMLFFSPIYGKFQKFMYRTIYKTYQYLEQKSKTTDLTIPEKRTKVLLNIYACRYGIPECIDDVRTQYKRWMDNPKNNTIDPHYKNHYYCNAIAIGGEKEWNFLLQMYKADGVNTDFLLVLLGCTRVPWILNRFLQMTIEKDSPITKPLAGKIMAYTAKNPVGRNLAWNFFRTNFNKLKEIYGHETLWKTIIEHVTKPFNTELELRELKAFKIEQGGNFGSGEAAMLQAIQKVESNVQWMNKHYKTIQEWLKANVN